MVDRAMMALFDKRHRLSLPGGWWLEKSDDDVWNIGGPLGDEPDVYLAMIITGSVPVGPGGSMDADVKTFADAMNGGAPAIPARKADDGGSAA